MLCYEKYNLTRISFYTRFQERVFLSKAKARKLVEEVANSTLKTPMTLRNFQELLIEIKNYPELINFLKAISTLSEDTVFIVPIFKDFVLLLAKDSPICASIFPTAKCLNVLKLALEGVDIRKDVNYMKTLSEDSPLLAELLRNILDSNFPPYMWGILSILMEHTLKPFNLIPEENRLKEPVTVLDKNLDKLSFLPTLPIICGRSNYVADKNTRRNQSCSKVFTGHPVLLPGVFTLYCEHGK